MTILIPRKPVEGSNDLFHWVRVERKIYLPKDWDRKEFDLPQNLILEQFWPFDGFMTAWPMMTALTLPINCYNIARVTFYPRIARPVYSYTGRMAVS